MPKLVLQSTSDLIDLDDILQKDYGMQALSGVTGLGLPDVQVQWLEGAGDGATFRGKRVRPRVIDLPLLIHAHDRDELKAMLSRLAMMLADECTLRLVDDDGSDWSTRVHRVGGGTYVYGVDTIGERDFKTVITVQAGDPYFTYSQATTKTIQNSGTGRNLISNISKLRVSSSQAIGSITLENTGDTVAYPLWDVVGPGRDFKAIAPNGDTIHWTGTLGTTESLHIDTKAGTVVDGTGANRYSELATAPRLWSIPPGTITATASLEDATAGTLSPISPPVATNLVTNPRGETISAGHAYAVGQLANVGGTGTPVLTPTVVGAAGSRFQRWTTPAGSPTADFRVAQSSAFAFVSLTAGATYTFMIRARLTGWDPDTLSVALCDDSGQNRVMDFQSFNIGPDYVDYSAVFVAGQAANSSTRLYVSLPSAAPVGVAGVLDIASWGIIPGGYGGTYFDGDTPDSEQFGFFAWTGTANASTSTRSLAFVSSRSSITCSWRPRKWLVI